MAVIVSEEAEEEKKFAKQKLVIKPHRERMNKLDQHGHDVEYNFKDPADPCNWSLYAPCGSLASTLLQFPRCI